MRSFEIIKEAVKEPGVKRVASDMNLSTSLIYKWCQENETELSAGADNPLDRVKKLYEITGQVSLIQWLCKEADGFFTHNPSGLDKDVSGKNPLKMTQKMLEEFSELLTAVSKSIENDDIIDEIETKHIRSLWEKLKTSTESFVLACEDGAYR